MKKKILIFVMLLSSVYISAQIDACAMAEGWKDCRHCFPIDWQPPMGNEPSTCPLTVCFIQVVECSDGSTCDLTSQDPGDCQNVYPQPSPDLFDKVCYSDPRACPKQFEYESPCRIKTRVVLKTPFEMITLSDHQSKVFIDKLWGNPVDGSYDFLWDMVVGSWHYDCAGNPIDPVPVIVRGFNNKPLDTWVTITSH